MRYFISESDQKIAFGLEEELVTLEYQVNRRTQMIRDLDWPGQME